MSIEAMKQALEALDAYSWEQVDSARAALRQAIEQAEKQEPVACAVCNEVHAILDADESKIIRNAKDGYPDGRTPRILTLQERVTALCVYASDWKRWCFENENTTPQPQREWVGLTDEEIEVIEVLRAPPVHPDFVDCDDWVEFARAIETKLKEKNT